MKYKTIEYKLYVLTAKSKCKLTINLTKNMKPKWVMDATVGYCAGVHFK